ncbi:TrbM/KikA/MpfK family conjugal transfer protein [Luteimonas sp. A649]
MKNALLAIALTLGLVLALASTGEARAQVGDDLLTGDTRLACEAVVCLSSGTRPSECSPSLSRYFNIQKRKLSDTLKARLDFLEMCPASNQTPEMASLVQAISRGAGRCDAASLNRTLTFWSGGDDGQVYIGNQLPEYCNQYTRHQYTDLGDGQARYVGDPGRGGHWVEAGDYDRALAAYNTRIQREDAERRNGGNGGRGIGSNWWER